MSTTEVLATSNPYLNGPCEQRPRALFYKNSGIFNLGGSLLDRGRFDTVSVRRIQAKLGEKELLLVVDLEDTWIRPFRSTTERERLIDSVLNKAPFLITSQSVFYVAFLPNVGVEKLVVGDVDILVLDRKEAKSRIVSSLAS